MDEGILREYKKNGPDIVDIVHPADAFIAFDGQAKVAVEQNYPAYFEAKTIPELAEKLGIDADKLQDTIDEYNEMCATGVDTKFHKEQKYLHPITGKGKIFEIPTEEVDFEVSESLKPGEECVVESGDSFKFEPVKADEVTDDEIKDAVEWAKKDEGLDLDVDALEKAAYKRRDDAKAGIDVDFEVHMDTPTSGVF
jgi:hypothetical protein